MVHERTAYPAQWQQIFRFPYSVGLSLAVLATAVLAIVWRSRGRREWLPGPEDFGATLAGRARFCGLAPLLLGIHVGTPLIVLGITGHLFSPNNALTGPWLYFLGVTEIGIGLSVVYGGLARR